MGRLIHILKGILIIEKEEYSYEKYWLSVKCWGIHPTSLLWHQS